MNQKREHARELARRYLGAGDALGWFEALYSQASGDPSQIPWAELRPNPNLVAWLDRACPPAENRTALVVGCGLGDDAEFLAQRGYRVTAFDISPTAIHWCAKRFPNSQVSYEVHDALKLHPEWRDAFEFVVEAYTLQVLPPAQRRQAMHQIAQWVAPAGLLLVIARGREPEEPQGQMPWPLTRHELDSFVRAGLVTEQFEAYLDDEQPPARRFRVCFRRQRT